MLFLQWLLSPQYWRSSQFENHCVIRARLYFRAANDIWPDCALLLRGGHISTNNINTTIIKSCLEYRYRCQQCLFMLDHGHTLCSLAASIVCIHAAVTLLVHRVNLLFPINHSSSVNGVCLVVMEITPHYMLILRQVWICF